jgi:hypothetical protein
MNRTLSCIRRRPNLVDLLTPIVAGVAGYRIKSANNFDGSYTELFTCTNVGFLDANVDGRKVELQQTSGRVRMVFDPATYAAPHTAALVDTNHIWLELWHVDSVGAETQISAPTLLLPDAAYHGYKTVVIHGAAPSGATIANSLQLDLPRLMTNLVVHNEEGTNPLFVAFEGSGGEVKLAANALPQHVAQNSPFSSLWVRGSGGTATFSASFTQAFTK